jgi:hypothetical protein
MHQEATFRLLPVVIFLLLSLIPLAAQDTTTIDLMVVWSKQADADANMNELAYEQVDGVNTCLSNSEIAVKIRPVLVSMIDYDETGIDAGQSHDYFKLGEGPLAFTRELRNEVGADLCCLIVESNSLVGRTTAWSEAGANPEKAFTTLSLTYLKSGYFVLPHELGHDMGCTHAPGEVQADYSFAYSYSHAHTFSADGMEYSTIMCAYYSKISTIFHYSNPDVLYKGVPTGIADERDNARTIRQTAGLVAEYRPTTIPVIVQKTSSTRARQVSLQSLPGSNYRIDGLCEGATMKLFSAAGRLVPCSIVPAGKGTWIIQKSRLSSGLYVLRIEQKTETTMLPVYF